MPETDGTPALGACIPSVAPQKSGEREGLELRFAAPTPAQAIRASDAWTLGGWKLQFVRLGPEQAIGLDQKAGKVHVKVIVGELCNIGRRAFAAPKQVADTRVSEDSIEAGAQGAVVAILTETPAVPDNVTSMGQLGIEGPLAEVFSWKSFEEKFGGFTDLFDGVDVYMSPGFHLLDENGVEFVYVWFWTAGKGVDLIPHNHSRKPSRTNPAFAEVHWVFNNGTGEGGMYECDDAKGSNRRPLPLQRGQEHGPFFLRDPKSAYPRRNEDGAVHYPWHGWQAGTDDSDGQAFDFVAAFEINPYYARLP